MPRGVKTLPEQEARFRGEYLQRGSIKAAAEAAGLPERTGWDLAQKANADPAFTKARDEIYARNLPDAECMLRTGLEIALERLQEGRGEATVDSTGRPWFQPDSGPGYLRNIIDGVKVLAGLRGKDSTSGETLGGRVIVQLVESPDAPATPPAADSEPGTDDSGESRA
jgi:hypothetical protein